MQMENRVALGLIGLPYLAILICTAASCAYLPASQHFQTIRETANTSTEPANPTLT
jgi:hypothetical protein